MGCLGGCELKIEGCVGVSVGGQGECERKIDFFCGNARKQLRGGGLGRRGRVDKWSLCENKKKIGGGGRGVGWGVRVDVNEEIK